MSWTVISWCLTTAIPSLLHSDTHSDHLISPAMTAQVNHTQPSHLTTITHHISPPHHHHHLLKHHTIITSYTITIIASHITIITSHIILHTITTSTPSPSSPPHHYHLHTIAIITSTPSPPPHHHHLHTITIITPHLTHHNHHFQSTDAVPRPCSSATATTEVSSG